VAVKASLLRAALQRTRHAGVRANQHPRIGRQGIAKAMHALVS